MILQNPCALDSRGYNTFLSFAYGGAKLFPHFATEPGHFRNKFLFGPPGRRVRARLFLIGHPRFRWLIALGAPVGEPSESAKHCRGSCVHAGLLELPIQALLGEPPVRPQNCPNPRAVAKSAGSARFPPVPPLLKLLN